MPTAMIWGANGGIGHALVKSLADRNWTVWAIARTPGSLKTLTPCVVQADVSDEHAVQHATLAAREAGARIDLWVYTVGDIAAVTVEEMTPELWRRILDANLTGAYLAARGSLSILAPNGHMFFLGAVSERMRLPRLSAYAAAKAGLESFAEALRKEQRGRRVTIVRPKAVDTPFWNKVPFKLPPRSLSPITAARRIITAYHEGHKGLLDI
jgi:NAD(P)-dependent dehydrogenase (short-subunit alcohol dehydrogenase family)